MKIQKSKNSKKIVLIIAVLALAIGAGVFAYFYMQKNATDDRKTQFGSESTNPTEDVPKPDTNSNSGTSIDGSKDNPSTGEPTSNPGQTPATPIGTFVSNHRPNLSGSPAPNTMNSTCSTTAGATCTIEFSNGTRTVSLPEKKTDANGNVSWDWKLQDVGLTAGSWSITAVAKNGSFVSKAVDPTNLEVKQ